MISKFNYASYFLFLIRVLDRKKTHWNEISFFHVSQNLYQFVQINLFIGMIFFAHNHAVFFQFENVFVSSFLGVLNISNCRENCAVRLLVRTQVILILNIYKSKVELRINIVFLSSYFIIYFTCDHFPYNYGGLKTVSLASLG